MRSFNPSINQQIENQVPWNKVIVAYNFDLPNAQYEFAAWASLRLHPDGPVGFVAQASGIYRAIRAFPS
jgi:hypothetical protein